MTGVKSIPQLKVMLTAFFQNASRHSHLRLSVGQQFGLAIMPTVVVLLMVACVEALRNQPLIFTSLASSAFWSISTPSIRQTGCGHSSLRKVARRFSALALFLCWVPDSSPLGWRWY